MRVAEPVARVDELGAWLVTRRDLALQVMRDDATFTVDDARFSTGQVVGRSMLTTDGAEHAPHRAPFAAPFRLAAVRERFTALVSQETERLLAALRPAREGELRRGFAGPLAARIVTEALGLANVGVDAVLGWYEAIVDATTRVTAGEAVTDRARAAVAELRAAVGEDAAASDLAVLL